MNYAEFLQNKQLVSTPTGHEPSSINAKLYDFQRDICKVGRPAW